jgi:hypothetical protein
MLVRVDEGSVSEWLSVGDYVRRYAGRPLAVLDLVAGDVVFEVPSEVRKDWYSYSCLTVSGPGLDLAISGSDSVWLCQGVEPGRREGRLRVESEEMVAGGLLKVGCQQLVGAPPSPGQDVSPRPGVRCFVPARVSRPVRRYGALTLLDTGFEAGQGFLCYSSSRSTGHVVPQFVPGEECELGLHEGAGPAYSVVLARETDALLVKCRASGNISIVPGERS